MSKKTQAITISGLGVVSPYGVGAEAFFEGLMQGRSCIKQIERLGSEAYGAQIGDFDVTVYLGKKGLRHIARGNKMLMIANKLAIIDYLRNAGKEISGIEQEDLYLENSGIIVGTTLGLFDEISEFDKESIRSGWIGVNPMKIPNYITNSAAGQIAIKNKARGPNLTISSGQTSSLDALGIAKNYLEDDQAQVVQVGGMGTLGQCIYLMYKNAGLLCKSSGEFNPLSDDRSGTLLGEGSVMFVLDKDNPAGIGIIEGYAASFNPKSQSNAEAAVRVIKKALEDANVAPTDIDFISSGLSGSPEGDRAELNAVKQVFKREIPIIGIKALIGETFDASGAFQVAAALHLFEKNSFPKNCTLDINSELAGKDLKRALITSFSFFGQNSALVLKSI